ncbi:MAG: hypothetical protein O7F71_15995, partial [Gammaproteobacteria bacterium]|nr:hypothetical protein [Gammaproteobacteria bacterium]
AARSPSELESVEVQDNTSHFQLTASIFALARDADEAELVRLLDEVAELRPVSFMQSATGALYQRYAELNPIAAFDHVLSRRHLFESQWIMQIFQSWARSDVDAAIDYAENLTSTLRMQGLSTILYERGDLPLELRQSIAAAIGVGYGNFMVDEDLVYGSVPLETLWENSISIDDPNARAARLYTISEHWGRRNPVAALAAINRLEQPGFARVLQQLIVTQWAERNPREVSDWVMGLPSSLQRQQMLGSSMEGWAKSDPDGAIDFMRSLVGQERQRGYTAILTGWISVNPKAAANWMANQNEFDVKINSYRSVAQSLARRDPEDAYEWAVQLPPEYARVAIVPVLNQLVSRDPPGYASLVDSIEDPTVKAVANERLVVHWGYSDPEAAWRWIERQDNAEQDNLTIKLMTSWVGSDANAAEEYLSEIDDPMVRDQAALGMIQSLYEDLDRAGRLYDGISDGPSRIKAANFLYRRWSNIDPIRAETYKITPSDGGS